MNTKTSGNQSKLAVHNIYGFAQELALAGKTRVTSPSDPLYQRVLCGMLGPQLDDFSSALEATMLLESEFERRAAELVQEAEALAVYYPQDLLCDGNGQPLALNAAAIVGAVAFPKAVGSQLFKDAVGEIDSSTLQASIADWALARKACAWVDPHLYVPDCTPYLPPVEWRAYLQRVGCRLQSGGAGKIVMYEQGFGEEHPFSAPRERLLNGKVYSVAHWTVQIVFTVPIFDSEHLDDQLFDDHLTAAMNEWFSMAARAVLKCLPSSLYEPCMFMADHLARPFDSAGTIENLLDERMPR